MDQDNIVFGINSVKSMLKNKPHLVIEFFIQDVVASKKTDLISLAKEHGISVQTISKQKLDKWLKDANHQGVVLRIKNAELITEKEFLSNFDFENPKNVFLILDEIKDPRNFGAILRTANALGVTAVIIPKDNSVSVNATVRKVSCGATEVTSIVKANNIARLLESLKQKGVWIMGTTLAENSQKISECDFSGPIALVMGSEDKGIRQLTVKHCDYLVHIPMKGSVESLNVSVATGIFLFEVVQRLEKNM